MSVYPIQGAQAQFSSTQGFDCGCCLDSPGEPLVFDAGTQRWKSNTQQGVFIWRTGLHPGISIDVIRRWTAPVDGQPKSTASVRLMPTTLESAGGQRVHGVSIMGAF